MNEFCWQWRTVQSAQYITALALWQTASRQFRSPYCRGAAREEEGLEQSICKYDAVTTTSAGLELDIRQLYFYIIWAWPLLICHSDEIQVKWVCKISKTISFHKWHLVIREWSLIITMMSSGEEDIIVSDTSFISFNQDTT